MIEYIGVEGDYLRIVSHYQYLSEANVSITVSVKHRHHQFHLGVFAFAAFAHVIHGFNERREFIHVEFLVAIDVLAREEIGNHALCLFVYGFIAAVFHYCDVFID